MEWIWDSVRCSCVRIHNENQQVSFWRLKQSLNMPSGTIPLRPVGEVGLTHTVFRSCQHAGANTSSTAYVIAPQFGSWMVEFRVWTDDAFPDNALLLRIFSEAGKQGIGLFHPPKKQFGQFRPILRLA